MASQSVPQYIAVMKQRMQLIGLNLGSDLSTVDAQTQVLYTTVLAMIAVLIKRGVDNGIWTDAQLISTLEAAIAAAFPTPVQPAQAPKT